MNEFTKSLYAGWQDKLEADQIECIRERAQRFNRGYVSAKQVFKTYKTEYHSNGIVHLYADKSHLYSMSWLKTFKQTGWHSYTHFLELIDVYIASANGDKSYLLMNIGRMAELQKAK